MRCTCYVAVVDEKGLEVLESVGTAPLGWQGAGQIKLAQRKFLQRWPGPIVAPSSRQASYTRTRNPEMQHQT